MQVILPGGLPVNGGLERRARFRPLTGRIEQALLEFRTNLDRPGYVTAVLDSALERIGNQATDAGCMTDLCVADRQYLMLRLAALLEGEQMWLKVGCGHCQALFDVDVQRCDLPVKPAGPGFPQVTLHVNEWTIDVRVPTGADQVLIAEKSESQAMQQLLQCCIRSVNGEPPGKAFIDKLCAADIAAIDEALDQASPAVCSQLLVTCPECGREQSAELDHYALAGMNEHDFYEEVHALASHYHWSEAVILDLPQVRRRRYLGMINRSAGMTS
jgi:hypothetical protein